MNLILSIWGIWGPAMALEKATQEEKESVTYGGLNSLCKNGAEQATFCC